jgi:hypothetical protein
MDRITRYLLANYSSLMTIPEHVAHGQILLAEKRATISSTSVREELARRLQEVHPCARDLLSDGPEQFFDRLTARLLTECRDDIFFNYCPKCGVLARTPLAQQCSQCYHAWH